MERVSYRAPKKKDVVLIELIVSCNQKSANTPMLEEEDMTPMTREHHRSVAESNVVANTTETELLSSRGESERYFLEN